MWIGLLTEGAHPARPADDHGVATLLAWGPRERARVDGPQAALVAGVRGMRAQGPASVGRACEPRCFACRAPYLIPDPDLVRAREDIQELGERTRDDDADPRGAVASEGAVYDVPPQAVFALVHVEDGTPVGREGEALVCIPGSPVLSLIPFDCLAEFAGILGQLGVPLSHCDGCGTLAPGGSLGEPSRSARRRAARAATRGSRRAA